MIIKNPNNVIRTVFSMLYAVVTDHPEGCKITCTMDTNKTRRPCSMCLVLKENLADMKDASEWRTEELCKKILKEGKDEPETLIEYSMHDVEPFIFGFNGSQNTVWGNPYKSLMVEQMHNAELGIWTHLLEYLRKVEKKKFVLL
jgi:Plavaka transposase